jgi:hypothetical protein
VLLEMFDLYDKQGRDAEAKDLWARMRQILMLKVQEHLYEVAAARQKRQRALASSKPGEESLSRRLAWGD